MRFLLTYLVLAIVFAFGFFCAATVAVEATSRRGDQPIRRPGVLVKLRDRVIE